MSERKVGNSFQVLPAPLYERGVFVQALIIEKLVKNQKTFFSVLDSRLRGSDDF